MVISLHTTQSPVSRSERMKINENWQRIIEGLSKLQLQINILAGGEEVDELILRINQAIEMVSTALQDTEKVIIEANKATMDAQEASDNANTAVQVINEAMGEAGQLMANLDALKAQLEQMKYKLETLSTEAEAATINANNAAQVVSNLTDAISEAITVANNATQEANNAAQLIAGWGTASVWNATTEYVKNNITTYNGSTWQSLTTNKNSVPSESNKDWILLAQRGVDGTGSVSMVAGKSPDADGNVPLTSIDIGAETPSGAQEKANKIQEWVQAHGLGTDQPELITLPDSLLNKQESGFWNVENEQGSVSLPNDIEDFHVYVGMKSDDQSNKIYQTFLAISQKTAKTYTRVITNDGQVNNHLDDTGWIEGGEGGTGSGLKLNINTYNLQTTMDHQKTWDLPRELYDKNNDEIIVFHNGIYLPPISWDITGNASSGYVLTIPDNPIEKQIDNNVSILIFKNVPTTGDEQFSGSLLTDGSVTMNKFSQDVQDRINSASEKVEIVDNLTVGGSNKALSAEMGKNLKGIVDEKVDKTELDVLETEVNEQMKPKVDNSWQKGVYNDTDIMNLKSFNVSRVFHIADWVAPVSNIEQVSIVIPATIFGGTVKVSVTGSYMGTDGSGAIEYETSYLKIDNTVHTYNRTIYKADSGIVTQYYFPDFNRNEHVFTIPIVRKPHALNRLSVKVELLGIYESFNMLKDAYLVYEDLGTSWNGYPWTPQISDIPTSANFGKWNAGYDAYTRFPGECNQITDWNLATQNGMYMGSNVANAPSTDWWMGITISHNDKYIVQKVIGVTNGQEFERQKYNGEWENWIETSPRKLFTSVASGKSEMASALGDKGVPTDANAPFSSFAANIRAIPTGTKKWVGTVTSTLDNRTYTYVNGVNTNLPSIIFTVPFQPTTVSCMGWINSTAAYNSIYESASDGNISGTVKFAYFNQSLASTQTQNFRAQVVNNGNGTWTMYMPSMQHPVTYTVKAFE